MFDTKFRSTLHGVSAASGKAGNIVGAFAIGKLFLETKVSETAYPPAAPALTPPRVWEAEARVGARAENSSFHASACQCFHQDAHQRWPSFAYAPHARSFASVGMPASCRCRHIISVTCLVPRPQVTLQVTLAILAATNAIGTLCTIFVPEAKRMTLKESALRSQSLFEKLIGGQVIACRRCSCGPNTSLTACTLLLIVAVSRYGR